jgi:hypothetical protein
VTLVADEADKGYKFSHWTNSAGETVGSDATLVIPECKTETYTAVYKEFQYFEGLDFISNGDGTCYVSGIGSCTDTDIVIPRKYNGLPVTELKEQAFKACNITSVIVPDSITTIGKLAFFSCKSLTSVIISDSVTAIGDEAFMSCESLLNVRMSNRTTTIGVNMFDGCKKLASMTIPNSVTTIGNSAFYECDSLKSVTIPKSVVTIGYHAFYWCKSLTSVTIPDSVTSIGGSAFATSENLTIYCEAISKPSVWNAEWNPDDRPVVWGAKLNFPSVNESLNAKLDKTTEAYKVYGTTSKGVPRLYGLANKPVEGNLAQYQNRGGGVLMTNAPVEDLDCVNKKHFDDNVKPISEKQNDLEERVADLESLTLTYTKDDATAYEKVAPAECGSRVQIKSIGGATKVIGKSKNILNPYEIKIKAFDDDQTIIPYTVNESGLITFTIENLYGATLNLYDCFNIPASYE